MDNIQVHQSAIIDDGARIGSGTRIWHFSHIMSTASVGNDCVVGQNVFIGANVRIGNGVKIQNNVSVYSGVEVEDDVFLGPSMVFTNVINPRSFIERKDEFRKTLVRKGATIGANATIICGTEIGEYAMIGAGAVVTADVPNYALITGIPGRVVGFVSRAGGRLNFEQDNVAVCSVDGSQYELIDGVVKPVF